MKESLEQKLAAVGQQHLLAYCPELTAAEREALAEQIAQVDFTALAELVERQDQAADVAALAARAEPPPAFRLGAGGNRFTATEARAAAVAALARGEIGAILVAGGQGTRLGFPHPKGDVSDRPGLGCPVVSGAVRKAAGSRTPLR